MRRAKITKELIVEKAINLFSEKGIDEVSMSEIANSLGVTKPVIYYYFKDKDEMIKYAFELKSKEMSQIFGKINKIYDIEKFIKDVINNHYSFFNKNESNIKCFFRIVDSNQRSYLLEMANNLVNNNRKMIKKYIDEIKQKDKRLKDTDTAIIVNFISSLISYLIMERKMKRRIDLKIFHRLIDIFLKGIMAIFFLFLSSSLYCRDLTLEDAINLAFENNVSVLNSYTSEKLYKERIREYYGGAYPQIFVSMGYTRNIEKPLAFFNAGKVEMGKDNSYSLSIDLSQVLWAGGKVDTGINMAKIYSDISKENTRLVKNTIRKSVSSLFYSILYAKELVNLNKDILDISNEHLNVVKEKYKQGLLNDLNVLRQEVEVSNNEPALIKALNMYKVGLLNLKNLLGLELEDDINLNGDFNCSIDTSTFDELYRKALLNRAEYRLSVLNKNMSEKQLLLEKSAYFPVLSAFASRQFSGVSDSGFPGERFRGWSFVAGIKLSLSAFNGFSTSSRVKQSEYNLEIAQRQVDDTLKKIKLEIKEALLDIEESKKRIESQKISVINARKVLESTEVRFKEGLASQLELNDATLSYNIARIGYTQALYDFCLNKINLDYVTGGER